MSMVDGGEQWTPIFLDRRDNINYERLAALKLNIKMKTDGEKMDQLVRCQKAEQLRLLNAYPSNILLYFLKDPHPWKILILYK